MRRSTVLTALAAGTVAVLAPATISAAVCTVPSAGYPTLAAALADPTCDPVQVAGGTLPESLAIARDVTITGAGSGSTTIAGWVSVTGATTDAVLTALRIDATSASAPLCFASGLDVRGGAKASGFDLVVVGRPNPIAACVLFADGFESGDTAPWSAKRP